MCYYDWNIWYFLFLFNYSSLQFFVRGFRPIFQILFCFVLFSSFEPIHFMFVVCHSYSALWLDVAQLTPHSIRNRDLYHSSCRYFSPCTLSTSTGFGWFFSLQKNEIQSIGNENAFDNLQSTNQGMKHEIQQANQNYIFLR